MTMTMTSNIMFKYHQVIISVTEPLVLIIFHFATPLAQKGGSQHLHTLPVSFNVDKTATPYPQLPKVPSLHAVRFPGLPRGSLPVTYLKAAFGLITLKSSKVYGSY